MDSISQYFGIDILAAIATFFGYYLLGNKKRSGFAMSFTGNLLWLGFGIMTLSWGVFVANAAFIVLNVRGFLKWRK